MHHRRSTPGGQVERVQSERQVGRERGHRERPRHGLCIAIRRHAPTAARRRPVQYILAILLGILLIFVGIIGGMCDLVTSIFR